MLRRYYRHREGRLDLAPSEGSPAADGDGDNGAGTGVRSLAQHKEALRACEDEARVAAEEYRKAIDGDGDGGANKKDRNRMKRRVTKAESRKLKLLRKIARIENGEDEDGEDDGAGETCPDCAEAGAEEAAEAGAAAKKARVDSPSEASAAAN